MPGGTQEGEAAGQDASAETSGPDRDDSENLRAAVELANTNRTPVVIQLPRQPLSCRRWWPPF